MEANFEIRPLRAINLDEILPIVTGYESDEKYAIQKSESDERILFDIRLVKLERPYAASFASDFGEEDCRRYAEYLPQGYSFGAYADGRLVAFAISEVIPWQNALRIWEFQVMQGYRRQGIGRVLMNHVVNKAREGGLRIVYLETQNTNVKAIRFYRKMGFWVDALDLSLYTNHDVEDGEVAFFMKQKLK